jgi:TRAP-type uncharacterized transport system fused permease subunit
VADKFIDPSRIEAAATCATAAGIIVGVVTLTGLGLKFSIIILSLAGSNLFLTVAYTASLCGFSVCDAGDSRHISG